MELEIVYLSGYLKCNKIQSKNHFHSFFCQTSGYARIGFDKLNPSQKYIILSKSNSQCFQDKTLTLEVSLYSSFYYFLAKYFTCFVIFQDHN